MDTELCAGGGNIKSTISGGKMGEQKSDDKKAQIKKEQYEKMMATYDMVRFRGAPLVFRDNRYTPLTSTLFAELFYDVFEHASIAQIREIEHKVGHKVPDKSHLDHLIQFGPTKVWNTRTLDWVTTDDSPVLRSPVAPAPTSRQKAFTYMLQLADGDEELAWDMLQAVAPLFMHKKPAGVIWFIGSGANGKSALLEALYKIIGHHLASMTVAAIEDGRDTPRLRGVIGNICRESSESRVVDAERYKAIGTHEPFEVHRFHAQAPIEIDTNFHTIFNANNIPIFSDKTEGARRRTLIVPFVAKFKDDPSFVERTFTPDFLGGLLTLILEATHIIRDNHYQYSFSEKTQGAKSEYDSEVNSAEAFLAHMRKNKVRAFTNFQLLRMSYESWCADNGLVPLGITNLKRVMMTQAKAVSKPARTANGFTRMYYIDGARTSEDLTSLDNGMQVGLKISASEEEPETEVKPVPQQEQSTLGKDW